MTEQLITVMQYTYCALFCFHYCVTVKFVQIKLQMRNGELCLPVTLTNSKPELYQLLINDCMRESRVRMSGLQKHSMRVITSHTQHTCNWLLILQKFPCKASQCTGPHGSQIGAHHLMTLLIVSVGKCAQLVQPHMNTSKYHSYSLLYAQWNAYKYSKTLDWHTCAHTLTHTYTHN